MANRPQGRSKKYLGLLRIGEAAELLEVSRETLRNWDRWGWLTPIRNPVTGYRYYRRDEVEAFRDQAVAERKGQD